MNNFLLKRKVLIIIIVVLLLLITLFKIECKYNMPIEEQIKNTRVVSEHTKDEIGNDINDMYNNYESIKFGNYYQKENSNKKNEIEWFVLDKNDEYALLLSKYILDVGKMSERDECQWSETILRNWLNSDFYNTAFNDNEKERIIECELENFNIPISLHKKQEKTKDKVFILSLDELQRYFYNDERKVNKELTTTATKFAFSKNKLIDFNSKDFEEEKKKYAKAFNLPLSAFNIKTTTYWTRTFKDNRCLVISYDGNIEGQIDGKSNLNIYNGVRPAIFVKIGDIATKSIISYDKLDKYNSLKKNTMEYDLSKTPIELKIYNINEKREYFQQLINERLEPKELKNFIAADQLDSIFGKTVNDLLQEIKRVAFQNVIYELLEGKISVNELPLSDNFVNNHSNLYKELNIDYDYWIGKPTEFEIDDDGKAYCNVSIAKVNKKNNSKVPKCVIILHFDDNGYIDDFDVFKY